MANQSNQSNQYEVVRTAQIAAPPAAVHAQINDFHKWQEWSPWEGMDPAQQRTYSGPDSGVGATYEWLGNRKVGQGRMKVLEDVEESKVVIALDFIKPFKSSSVTTFEIAEAAPGASTVTWRLVGTKTFMTRVMGVFKSMDAMIGPDFEKGLAKLSTVVTKS
jgi:hypothetical protein